MKYIRTKDGKIFDSFALKVEEIAYKDEQGEWCKEWRTINPLKKVLKIADTIEELCDEFRVRDNDNYLTYEIDITCRNLKELYEELQIQNQTLFGAIWTDKGLIYVAKLNDKGELELI